VRVGKAVLAPADLSTANLQVRLAATEPELTRVSDQRDILKKRWPFSPSHDRYTRIDAMKDEHFIAALCWHLAVSSSGYYDRQQRREHPGVQAVADQQLGRQIGTIFAVSRQTHGSLRIQ